MLGLEMATMEALLCSAPGTLELVRIPTATRATGEVLVRPRRVGICGTDYHIFEGKHPFLAYPRIMGHELAVEVVESGDSGLQVGAIMVVNPYLSCGECIACRRCKPNCCTSIAVLGVHRDGGMTELLSLPAKNLVPAQGLSSDACATVEFLAIGAHAVRRAALSAEDRVLVIGAGPIGFGAALFAVRSGAEVHVMDRDPERLAVSEELLGISGTILAGEDVDAQVSAATGGDGFDVVFDATGNQSSIEKGFDFAAHGGRYVLISVVKGDIRFADSDFHRREMTVLGSRNATSEDFETVIAAIAAGHVPIDRLITHRTSLGGAITDLPRWATQKTGLIKAVIEMS
jgi:2-desacetyl-2-hydroxyethyl bacteriochlorophyllide A dehydrogenase